MLDRYQPTDTVQQISSSNTIDWRSYGAVPGTAPDLWRSCGAVVAQFWRSSGAVLAQFSWPVCLVLYDVPTSYMFA